METATETTMVELANGVKMPKVGLGVLKAKDGLEVENAVLNALNNGYRMIDTAAAYRNEKGVGDAIKKSGVDRESIFLTTKVWNSDQGYEETLMAFEDSLRKLGTDYVDLYLVHWPVKEKYKETWRAMEKIYREGKAKAIGVSNFQIHHLKDLMTVAEIKPMVNQVEMHPLLQQEELFHYAHDQNIKLEAWRPIMMGEVNDIQELQDLAIKYDKSPAQVTLRWLIQKGVAVIPKSVTPKRIMENIDLFDFELSEADMVIMASLNQNRRLGPDPDNFNF